MDGEIKIIDHGNVVIGGVNVGCVADAIRNIPVRASDLQRALTAHLGERDATHAESIAAKEKAHANAYSEQQAVKDAEIASLESQLREVLKLAKADGDRFIAQRDDARDQLAKVIAERDGLLEKYSVEIKEDRRIAALAKAAELRAKANQLEAEHGVEVLPASTAMLE